MSLADFFEFTDDPSIGVDSFVARVPAGIPSAKALFLALYEEMHLPGYFGSNWNALSDCMRDLHWIEQYNVVLLHADVPDLPSDELRTYLEVLAECVASWKPGEDHLLRVFFPSTARFRVGRFG